jgi:hypothetical protein
VTESEQLSSHQIETVVANIEQIPFLVVDEVLLTDAAEDVKLNLELIESIDTQP